MRRAISSSVPLPSWRWIMALKRRPHRRGQWSQGLLAQAIALVLLIGASVALFMSQSQRDGAERARERSKVHGRHRLHRRGRHRPCPEVR
jgi:hypothetical protein